MVKDNKIIIVDGVHYETSLADWKHLQRLLRRATVVPTDIALQMMSAVVIELEPRMMVVDGVYYKIPFVHWLTFNNILECRGTVVSRDTNNKKPYGKLTDTIVECLVGHKNVVYYNCETNTWNKDKYDGCEIVKDDALPKKFKAKLEEIPKFGRHYEMVAPVMMKIREPKPSFCARYMMHFIYADSMVSLPQYHQAGTFIVGNIIVRNRETGMYDLYTRDWIRGYIHSGDTGVTNGIYEFLMQGVWHNRFWAELISAYTR